MASSVAADAPAPPSIAAAASLAAPARLSKQELTKKHLVEVMVGFRENEKMFRECLEYAAGSISAEDKRVLHDLLAKIALEV